MTRKTQSTKIIAELGNIHLHDMEGCKIAIRDAFNAGADLVKLQCINPLTAYWASKEQIDRYKKIAWTIQEWHNFLLEMNSKHDNRVFVSTFDEMFIDALSDVVSYWKVAFRMRDDRLMIAKMIWTEKPIFFTTRGKYYEVDNERYFRTANSNFNVLFGTRYDKPYDQLAPLVLRQLKVGKYAGVSINFGGDYAINLCKSIGPMCEWIELHVKGERANGPDTEWSFTMNQLERVKKENLM